MSDASQKMTPRTTGYGNIEFADLMMSTHTRVLGVDICVHQQAIWEEVHGDGRRGGLEADIQIERPGVDRRLDVRDRRYIAAWARRNLFNGAGPQ